MYIRLRLSDHKTRWNKI